VRVRPDPFAGTPFPKDEPAAENPPFGAYIDYALAAPPASPIEMIVRAADGSEVRRYSSDDRPASPNPASSEFAPEWAERPSSLATTAGIHRFVWPVRYAAAGALGSGPFSDGVWAPPGKYSIELIVDGKSFTQPFEILPDPRIRIPASAYAEQFKLAKRIEGLRVRVAEAARAAGKLQSALTERRTNASGAASLLEDFQQKLTAVTGSVPATIPGNVWWIPGKASSLRFVSEKLEALDLAVEGADAAPSPDARAGVAKVEAMVPVVLASWDRLKGAELDALNAQLAAAGQAQIVIATPGRNPGGGPAPRR
jgi:uncharacterized coiled-coil protein SlyX